MRCWRMSGGRKVPARQIESAYSVVAKPVLVNAEAFFAQEQKERFTFSP